MNIKLIGVHLLAIHVCAPSYHPVVRLKNYIYVRVLTSKRLLLFSSLSGLARYLPRHVVYMQLVLHLLSQVSQAASLVKLTCVAVSPGLNCCSRAVPRAVAVPQDRLLVVSQGPVLGRPSRTQCELYSGLSAASRVDPVDLSVLQDSVQLVKLFLWRQVFSRIWSGSCSRRPSAARSRRGSKPYYLYYNFFLH